MTDSKPIIDNINIPVCQNFIQSFIKSNATAINNYLYSSGSFYFSVPNYCIRTNGRSNYTSIHIDYPAKIDIISTPNTHILLAEVSLKQYKFGNVNNIVYF